MIHYKTVEEQDAMRAVGKLAAQTLEYIEPLMVAGTSTITIDEYVRIFAEEHGAECATLGYHGFPAHCCISVNEVACHGIGGDYVLQDGDIVNVDVTPTLDGWHGDTSKMFKIGDVSPEDIKLCRVAHEAMWAGIQAIEVGEDINVIGKAIEEYMKRENRFTIAKHYCGHGTGLVFHEDPQIVHYSHWAKTVPIERGMTFTVEPIINAGSANTVVSDEDNWTVTTLDGKKSAQWEHTILITEDEDVEVLTLREEEK